MVDILNNGLNIHIKALQLTTKSGAPVGALLFLSTELKR